MGVLLYASHDPKITRGGIAPDAKRLCSPAQDDLIVSPFRSRSRR